MRAGTAFVSVSFAHKDDLAPELDAIVAALDDAGLRAHVFVRAYTFGPDEGRAMMAATQADLRAVDLLVAELTHKAIGVGIEIGYAAALGKPVIVVRRAGADPSTTAGGLADAVVVYDSPANLRARLFAALRALGLSGAI
jgi:2'-deoxynucleoside 5'-phosphate N-hydrolase